MKFGKRTSAIVTESVLIVNYEKIPNAKALTTCFIVTMAKATTTNSETRSSKIINYNVVKL